MSERTRIISTNDLGVITTQFLDAAKAIHIAQARLNDDSPVHSYLNDAMHCVLIGAEQCRQLHKSSKQRLAEPEKDEDTP